MAALAPLPGGLSTTPEDQLHLTLSFYGDVAPDSEKLLKEALSEIELPAFYLSFEGLGYFTRKGRPTVIWVGVGTGHPHLFALHRFVLDAALKAGIEPDLRPFHPHVTLARPKARLSFQLLRPFLRKHEKDQFGIAHMTDFCLFSSRLKPAGPEHRVELRRSLATS